MFKFLVISIGVMIFVFLVRLLTLYEKGHFQPQTSPHIQSGTGYSLIQITPKQSKKESPVILEKRLSIQTSILRECIDVKWNANGVIYYVSTTAGIYLMFRNIIKTHPKLSAFSEYICRSNTNGVTKDISKNIIRLHTRCVKYRVGCSSVCEISCAIDSLAIKREVIVMFEWKAWSCDKHNPGSLYIQRMTPMAQSNIAKKTPRQAQLQQC
eukprot:972452_1